LSNGFLVCLASSLECARLARCWLCGCRHWQDRLSDESTLQEPGARLARVARQAETLRANQRSRFCRFGLLLAWCLTLGSLCAGGLGRACGVARAVWERCVRVLVVRRRWAPCACPPKLALVHCGCRNQKMRESQGPAGACRRTPPPLTLALFLTR